MNQSSTHICILGGGFGGLYTALYLSRHPWVRSGRCKITLVEQKDHFLFTPLLYELLTGELQRWEIAPTYQKLLRSTNIDFCQHKIQGLDLKTRQVSLDNGETLSYDYLVLGVGTQNRWPNIPGLQTHALTFRTLEDVEQLQGRLHLLEATERERIRVAVVGGGPNGVELASKLADRLGKRGKLYLVETGHDILKGFGEGVRKASYKALMTRRVRVRLNTCVSRIEADSITLTCEDQETTIAVDLVIWAAGTQSWEWVKGLGCQQNPQGKLLVNSRLQLMDYPEVFALGDMAEIHPYRQRIPSTAQAAYQAASCAAKNLAAKMEGKGLKSFYYLHLGDMLTLGKRSAVVSCLFLNLEGRLADIIRRLAYIFRLPTMRHRLQVLRSLFDKVMLRVRHQFSWQVNRLLSFDSAKD